MKKSTQKPAKHGVIQLSRTDNTASHTTVRSRAHIAADEAIPLGASSKNRVRIVHKKRPDLSIQAIQLKMQQRYFSVSSGAISALWLGLVVVVVVSILAFIPSHPHRHSYVHSGNDRLANKLSKAYLTRGTSQLPKLKPVVAFDALLPDLTVTPLQPLAPLLDCSRKTVMNIIAHEDDDLLFINPDVTHDIHAGNCVRTVYLTAGDDGRSMGYLRSREVGAEKAYDSMLGSAESWQSSQLTLPSGKTVLVNTPIDNQSVSLIFLRLPDGNLSGDGFATTNFQSLSKLQNGSITSITSVDHQNTYDSSQLTATLEQLMDRYRPATINTQANDGGQAIADHSDHIATGQFTTAAATGYVSREGLSLASVLHYFMGYPIRGLPENVSAGDAQQKAAAFFAYGAYDSSVCHSLADCATSNSSYALYISRQYGAAN